MRDSRPHAPARAGQGAATAFAAPCILVILVLASCTKTTGSDPALAKKCQFQPCECVEASYTLGYSPKRAPLLWRDNGDAACPEGFVLVRGEKEVKRR